MAATTKAPKDEVLEAIGQVRKILAEPQPLSRVQIIQANSFLELAEELTAGSLTNARPRKAEVPS